MQAGAFCGDELAGCRSLARFGLADPKRAITPSGAAHQTLYRLVHDRKQFVTRLGGKYLGEMSPGFCHALVGLHKTGWFRNRVCSHRVVVDYHPARYHMLTQTEIGR